MDPDSVSKAFMEHFFSTFDTSRANLGTLYQGTSMLTFEGQKFQGAQNIVAKLAVFLLSSTSTTSALSISSPLAQPVECLSSSTTISSLPGNSTLSSLARCLI
ncbi:hypothetical protein G4B88_018802 [Cannabis sativa]|uniref:NTF2 domain-containing protein n=1 Tax=Cannabis sativa TaxID=3483 RepID=A0A7J6EKM3_CANSA|nr:hypothetical protein G4B88_018802 [Cannabis sativa]